MKRFKLNPRFFVMLVAALAMVGAVACGDDPAEGNNDNNGNNTDPCEGVSCEAQEDFCDGDVAVMHTDAGMCDPDSGECDYSAVEERTDCTESGQVCDGGACVDAEDLCEGVDCAAQDPYCEGDMLVSHSDAGTCDADSGACDYSGVEEMTDCTENNQVCDGGACVDPDPCEGVTCDAQDDYCDGDMLVSHTGAGMCVEADGSCDYSAVEETTDCTDNNQICQDGACVDEPVDLCEDVTCEPQDAYCDGDTVVSHTGAGVCVEADGTCDYSGVEERTDCTGGDVCNMGACIDPNDTSVNAGDLVVTEIMQNPDAVGDGDGEYFEVYNTTARLLHLNGMKVMDNDGDTFTVTDPNTNPIEVAAGGYFVFGKNANTAENGGITVGYEYAGAMSLANGDDEVVLLNANDVEIDRVEYDGGSVFPDPTGASMQFGAEFDKANNDDGSQWCQSRDEIAPNAAETDLGTPGAANADCTLPTVVVSVYDMKDPANNNQPAMGQSVEVNGVVVTAVDVANNAAWLQEPAGGERSGIFVDITNVATTPAVGDTVDIEGTFAEGQWPTLGVLMVDIASMTIGANSPITPDVVDASVLADSATAEAWEGVLVELAQPAVTNEEPDGTDDYGEFRVDAGIRVDDGLYDYDVQVADPVSCDVFASITGVLHYSHNNYKVLPRDGADFPAPTAVTAEGAAASVNISNNAYAPEDVCVDSNGEITWTNDDAAAHTVTERDPTTDQAKSSPAFDENLSATMSHTETFANAGTYHYLCTIHPSMTGRVIVLE